MQAEAFKHDANRVTGENNRLHRQQLQAADTSDAASRQSYKETKARDAQLAELGFWKQRQVEKIRVLEAENEGLKARLAAAEDQGEGEKLLICWGGKLVVCCCLLLTGEALTWLQLHICARAAQA